MGYWRGIINLRALRRSSFSSAKELNATIEQCYHLRPEQKPFNLAINSDTISERLANPCEKFLTTASQGYLMHHLSTRIKKNSSNKTLTYRQTGTELRAEPAQRLHELPTQSKIKTPASEWHPEAFREQPWVQAKNERIAKVIPEDVSPRNHSS
jgi:hypothetical protein